MMDWCYLDWLVGAVYHIRWLALRVRRMFLGNGWEYLAGIGSVMVILAASRDLEN